MYFNLFACLLAAYTIKCENHFSSPPSSSTAPHRTQSMHLAMCKLNGLQLLFNLILLQLICSGCTSRYMLVVSSTRIAGIRRICTWEEWALEDEEKVFLQVINVSLSVTRSVLCLNLLISRIETISLFTVVQVITANCMLILLLKTLNRLMSGERDAILIYVVKG